jgi:DNA primase
LGWSGEGRGALAAALRSQNMKPEQLVEAGLMKRGERGPVDMFFSRVMFPISDRRGAKISFGGRIMGDGQPKYVNGPETAAFSKRRSLYNLHVAREAVRKGGALIVVEGYMDAIALAQAGFRGAVAPLGTALTEEHLEEIWRLTPSPVICFDADAAGRRAALKTVDMALAGLAPDRTLKFLRLPDKDDPDSLVKREGPAAFKARLDAAEPLSSALYDMLADGAGRGTPEARAAFRQRLVDTANRIPDKGLAGEYRSMLLERFFAERGGKGGKGAKQVKPPTFVRQPLPDGAESNLRRARQLLAILLLHPALIPEVEEAFARVALPESYARLREAFSGFAGGIKTLDTDGLVTHLGKLGLSDEARQIVAAAAEEHRLDPAASPAEVAQTWWSWYILMDFSIDMLRSQRDEQQRYCLEHQDDRAAWTRLAKYIELLHQAMAGEYGAVDS